MSRTGLHRPRLSRTATRRPASGTRLLPGSFTFPYPVLHPNTHNKRCPKAQRLRLRSDQSPPRSMQGRSPDKSRHTLPKGRCQVRAPLIGRNGFAPSGDAKEHGVMLLHRAIAPFLDSTVVTIGELWSMNGGHGSSLPSLGVVEHFRWTRLPQSENVSRLVHILSEVWGCRRFDADVDRPQGRTPRIGTGVADYLRKPSGTFHLLPRFAMSSRGPARDLKRPSQDMAFTADHPHPTSGSVRGTASRTLKGWAGMRLMSSLPTNTKLEGSTCTEAQALPPVFPFPSPLKAPRERGIKGVRVPSPPPAPREIPGKPFSRRSIKPATSSINVQSTFNQNPTPQLNKIRCSIIPSDRDRTLCKLPPPP